MTPQPARERLLGMEQYNSRSVHLITEEAIDAIEAEAVAAAMARIREAVQVMPGTSANGLATGGNDDSAVWAAADRVDRAAVLAAIDREGAR